MQRSRHCRRSPQHPRARIRWGTGRGVLLGLCIGLGLLVWSGRSAGQTPPSHVAPEPPSQQPRVQQPHAPRGQLERPGAVVVTVDRGKLSVVLREAAFRDVMAVIARQSGIAIRGLGWEGQAPLTDAFEGLSLDAGLRRLLRGRNYVVVYAGAESQQPISHVMVLPGQSGQPAPPSTTPVSLADGVRESLDAQRLVEAVQTAIITQGGSLPNAQTWPTTVDPALNVLLQGVIAGQVDKQLVTDQFRQIADKLQQFLAQQRP